MAMDPVRRFSSRVEAYVRYRPSYPPAVLSFLHEECELNAYSQVADIGSGTGILTQLLLDYGCEVTGVEPNAGMRGAAEKLLAGYERFRSVDATAEATTLPAHAFDLVTAGQAFHWFQPDRARAEFARILRPPRWVALIWNKRVIEGDPFLAGYDALLHRYGTDYAAVDHRNIDDGAKNAFFQHANWKNACFENRQEFDWEGLCGRVESTSYAPAGGSPEHAALMTELRRLFDTHSRDGRVVFRYSTSVYAGTLPPETHSL